MIKRITVDSGMCIRCGMCIKDCIVQCLEFDADKIPRYVEDGKDMCVACQHCMAICPKGALSFGNKNPYASEIVSYGNSEDLLRLIKSRRSFRFFQKQDIPPEKLSKIVDMLAYPPKGGNADSLHFSIVATAEKMRAIEKFTYDTINAIENPSPVIESCRNCYNNGIDFIYRGAAALVAVSVDKSKAIAGCENADPIIALSYLDLYAQSLELGTLWTDATVSVMKELPEVRSLLEIPDECELNYVMLLGVPAIKYRRTVQREPANVTMIR